MFNGLIRVCGTLQEIAEAEAYRRFLIQAPVDFVQMLSCGDSVAVNGCCLSVIATQSHYFSVDVSKETLSCTALGQYIHGQSLHLEPPLRLSDRIDGHLLTGHVDGVGRLKSLEVVGQGITAVFDYPSVLYPYIAKKGSIAIDGVSLTVNAVTLNTFAVHWIPVTLEKTHFASLAIGDGVNLEVDLIARYWVHAMKAREELGHGL